jgi:hypothetical protein
MSPSSGDQNNNCPICLSSVFGPAAGEDPDTGHEHSPSNSNKNDICATVPCGHLYHHTCFSLWQSSQQHHARGGRGGGVKCPTCNIRTTSCVKLFLSLEGLTRPGNEDEDDISLSSAEQPLAENDNEEERDGGDERGGGEEEADPDDADRDNDDYDSDDNDFEAGRQMMTRKTGGNGRKRSGDDRPPTRTHSRLPPHSQWMKSDESATPGTEFSTTSDVVDLTLSPASRQEQQQQHRAGVGVSSQRSSTSTTEITALSESTTATSLWSSSSVDGATPLSSLPGTIQRLTRIAKGYKRKFLQRNAECQRHSEEKKRLADQVRDYETNVGHLRAENDQKDQEMEEMERCVENAYLKEQAALRELRELRRNIQEHDCEVTRLERLNAALEKDNAGLHAHYQRKLEHALAKPELQQVLVEHPKVVEENRRLKEQIQKLSIQALRRDSTMRVLGDTTIDAVSGSSSSSSKRGTTKEMTKALRQMDAQVRNDRGSLPLLSVEVCHGVPLDRTSSNRSNKKKPPPPGLSSSLAHLQSTTKEKPFVVDWARYSAMASRMIPATTSALTAKGNIMASQNASFAKAMLFSSSSSASSTGGNSTKRASNSSSQRPAGTAAMTSSSIASQKKRPKTDSASRRGIFDHPR